MNKKTFNRAQQLYEDIKTAQQYIKDIKFYEQKHYNKGIPLTLKVPWSTGMYGVDCDIVIKDKEVIKEVLNTVKIHCVKVIQDAKKELETL